ncbi:hypothetical protein C7M61_001079 [Candidozyma pseudohaemuli]|uniref:2-dehydropantoate 2-reductase n=1 Tax=Candidozyma pseudohaemuli TaxID=418784 RepID=A0A2P7YZL0_9ASCO|nr:hypothetical protein C7M61_001079 [[Candida] pseudohaemulonii]PSK41397.1 hypothetical protein C7M61_001079 [[Candida] pseudohaemulonii]
MSKPSVLVVGSGGVGTIAALSLTLNEKCNVTLVVRSAFDKASTEGFTINSVTYGNLKNWKPTHVSKSVESAVAENGPFDYIVVTTKNIPDGPLPCEQIIKPAVVDGVNTVVLIQNGIGIEEPMIKAYPKNPVLSGISLIGSTNINCTVDNLHKDTLKLGPFHNPNILDELTMEKVREFALLYQNVSKDVNEVIIEDSALSSRWEKLVYNMVLNTTCTVAGLDVNRCQIGEANENIFRPAMNEVLAIAKSEGVELPDLTSDYFIHIGDGLFYSPSMLVDSRKKQLFELEVILGNPLRTASKNGVSTPVLSTLYGLLKMIQLRIKEEIGVVQINEADYKGINSDDYPKTFQELQSKKV